MVSFCGLIGCYCGTIGRCSSGIGYFEAVLLGTTRALFSAWDCKATGEKEDGGKAWGLIRVKRADTMLR